MKIHLGLFAAVLIATPVSAQIYNRSGVSVGLPQGGSIGSYIGDDKKSHGYVDVVGPLGNHNFSDDRGQSCTSVPMGDDGSMSTNCSR